MMSEEAILKVDKVSKSFRRMSPNGKKESFQAVKEVSFSLRHGEIVGLLGESGCGKTTLARLILGMEHPDSGKIYWKGLEIQNLSEKGYRPLRRDIQMIFQNPFGSLDNRMTIQKILMEPLSIWRIGEGKAERQELIKGVLSSCGLTEDILKKKPTEFSGGQLQRIAIARALLLKPKFLVADEIVSALDVSVQNQILELLLEMKEEYGLTILFISHDLAVIHRISDHMLVMRNGCLQNTVEDSTYLEELKRAVFTVTE